MSHSVASNRWSREAIEQLYKQSFQPEDYLKTYYGHLDAEVQFFLCNLHDFFSHGTRLLVNIENYKRRVYRCIYF